MTLTKTQQVLIERARANGGTSSVEAGSGRGAKGGRVTFGSRERTALWGLVDAGLVAVKHTLKDIECNRGYSIHSTSFVYELKAEV